MDIYMSRTALYCLSIVVVGRKLISGFETSNIDRWTESTVSGSFAKHGNLKNEQIFLKFCRYFIKKIGQIGR